MAQMGPLTEVFMAVCRLWWMHGHFCMIKKPPDRRLFYHFHLNRIILQFKRTVAGHMAANINRHWKPSNMRTIGLDIHA